jgi:hypothetical protein
VKLSASKRRALRPARRVSSTTALMPDVTSARILP